MNAKSQRLIVVSNRLPFVLKKDDEGNWQFHQGSGGLVTAMVPVLSNRGGMWIGWPGTTENIPELDQIIEDATRDVGYTFAQVYLDKEEHDKFYYGASNEVIWPLFHDLQTNCNFDPTYWHAYETVNEKYAEAVCRHAHEDDFVWIQDYQLMLGAHYMRQRGFQGNVGFFLHIPFPPVDIFMKLPRRRRLLRALLEYDLIGFQTQRDRRNFLQCVRLLLKEARVVPRGPLHEIRTPDRDMHIGSFPIGIDFDQFANGAASEEVSTRAWNIHAGLPERKIVFCADRLDYTKGIPQRLKAFENLLDRYPEMHRKITLIQVVVPSRADIPEYQLLREEIERLVSQINGRFTYGGWVPIHYIYRNLDRPELLAYYRTSEIALITPLKDGMNLVSKEYCACSLEEEGVVVLSEFAGSAAQLQKGAILVNPYDIEEVADAIHQAYHMDVAERKSRMRRIRRQVRTYDIFWWVDAFMRAAIDRRLEDFPIQESIIYPEREDEHEVAEMESESHASQNI